MVPLEPVVLLETEMPLTLFAMLTVTPVTLFAIETEIPVVALALETEMPVVAEADVALTAVLLTPIWVWLMPPDEVLPGRLWKCPGSETDAGWVWPVSVTVAVWL